MSRRRAVSTTRLFSASRSRGCWLIPNPKRWSATSRVSVSGSEFRRVTFADGRRGGLLGQGSILTATAQPNRTSPVVRGKWILENLLGSPPPPPPANVPALKENGEGGAPPTSVRE